MRKAKTWFIYSFPLLLIVTFVSVKWLTEQKRELISQHEQDMSIIIDKIVAGTSDAYQWPMETIGILQDYAEFGQAPRFPNLYHSAVDYFAMPGTEVYAIADGVVYYSDHQESYGGVVVIEHPQDGVYSLYGHVSSRQWLIEAGQPVNKGDLVGYIAETDEGYGIGIVPHLHFSIRLGSPSDYPSHGRSNWMTGYTTEHPVYHQFVHPSYFITQSKYFHREEVVE